MIEGMPAQTKVQTAVQEFFIGEELNMSIKPDEAGDSDAAVQAAIITGTGSFAGVLDPPGLIECCPEESDDEDSKQSQTTPRPSQEPKEDGRVS